MSTYKTFNIGFTYKGYDETQFDVHVGTQESELNELGQLFKDFCAENNMHDVDINYIREVPYDGEDTHGVAVNSTIAVSYDGDKE